MTNTNSNRRKAAILIRSLDADTAARLLGQLSPEEAAAVRAELRALGPIDPEEQADVLAEFRLARPLHNEPPARGVELALSVESQDTELRAERATRFEFLEQAPIDSLVPYLSREHAQTIAVVLSHLAPARAAAVLAALPGNLQAETIERITALGDADAESVTVLERELATWMQNRVGSCANHGRGRDAVLAIMAAADTTARDGILRTLNIHKPALAERVAPAARRRGTQLTNPQRPTSRPVMQESQMRAKIQQTPRRGDFPASSSPPPVRSIDFEDLINLDNRTLAIVLQKADAAVLALALAGSSDELVDRICDQMPKRVARAFRRELRRMGPTRLSDVEAAQQTVAEIAAVQMNARRRTLVGTGS